ncbi:MAG: tetratricopeptide repeat protein [Verrucomicrobia bacterium]|nr:tetratricopeptide repeat protein [Verrucomicrobiota bacterium]
MSNLLIGLLSALVATNQAAVVSNLVVQTTGVRVNIPDPNDPVEKEYLSLLEKDDAAQEEADKWIRDHQAFEAAGAGTSRAALAARIEQRFESVRKAYDGFLQHHPKHTRARLAYGSFLNDTGQEDEAVVQWEKARELDPKNPAAWNNLANHYGHRGPVDKAFAYYEKALELNPREPVYLQNLATTTYLFRRDAMEYYKITEPQVFDRALELYRKALKLDPTNFILAHDLAQSYYGIKPLRTADALAAWKQALDLAHDDIEREGVYLHMARVELNSGLFEPARKHLLSVTNQIHLDLKNRLLRNLTQKENQGQTTNSPPAQTLETK